MTDGAAPADLFAHAAAGTVCVLGGSPEQRLVDAADLYELCAGREMSVHPRGVRLVGALIEDHLDFEHAVLRVPLVLGRCELLGGLTLVSAHAPAIELIECAVSGPSDASWLRTGRLELTRCVLSQRLALTRATVDDDLSLAGMKIDEPDADGTALLADRLQLGGSLLLGGADLSGAIRLANASIGGNLEMDGAEVTVNQGIGVHADGLRVHGSLFLGDGFHTNGAVRLAGATIEGNLELDGAKLTGTDRHGDALVADSLELRDDLFLHKGFEASGAIRLANASIGGDLEMAGAKVTVNQGTAVLADGLQVRGRVFLSEGFDTNAAVRLVGAVIDGQLSCSGASISGADEDGNSLLCDGLRAGSDVHLRKGFTSEGVVRFAGATIGGTLGMDGAKLNGTDHHDSSLVAERLTVRGHARLRDGFEAAGAVTLSKAVVEGELAIARATMRRLVLAGARCGELADDEGSWPPEGRLELRGFRFGALATCSGWKQRLDWVRRQGLKDWSPDPYEQLTTFYASTGDETAVRRISIAKHDDELDHLKATRKPARWATASGAARSGGWSAMAIDGTEPVGCWPSCSSSRPSCSVRPRSTVAWHPAIRRCAGSRAERPTAASTQRCTGPTSSFPSSTSVRRRPGIR